MYKRMVKSKFRAWYTLLHWIPLHAAKRARTGTLLSSSLCLTSLCPYMCIALYTCAYPLYNVRKSKDHTCFLTFAFAYQQHPWWDKSSPCGRYEQPQALIYYRKEVKASLTIHHTLPSLRRKTRLIESNAKCCYLQKLTCKADFAASVLPVWDMSPYSLLPTWLTVSPVYKL